MSAMALPGPWSWNARGGRSGRPGRSRGFWGWAPDDAPRDRPRGYYGEHHESHHDGGPHGHRARFGPPPTPPQPPFGPPPQTPPGMPPWGGGPFGHGPGPGFGGFGPGGGFGRGGRGGRGGHRAKRGDVRTGILLLLAEESRSGYEIIREGRERSGGMWRPSPGSVYPMLQQLEDEGLVVQEEGEGRRRPYRLTEEGVDYLEENAAGLTPPWEAVADAYADSRSRYEEISALAYQLSAAAAQVVQAGTDEQVEQAKRLLGDSTRSLYRILAEEAPGPNAPRAADTGVDEDGD